ncbi:MAG: hypothetical protein HDS81_01350 [Bacteroidales bacterium]|nr:hypothetical protein [Bacteroidales bacterium]
MAITFSLSTDTSGYAYGVGSLHSIANPQPPFAFPGRQCRCAALPPALGAVANLHVPPTR